jgi:hypothetical protein
VELFFNSKKKTTFLPGIVGHGGVKIFKSLDKYVTWSFLGGLIIFRIYNWRQFALFHFQKSIQKLFFYEFIEY